MAITQVEQRLTATPTGRSRRLRWGLELLLIASLCAQGRSVIYNIGQIDRGYERIDERLRGLGAQIERV